MSFLTFRTPELLSSSAVPVSTTVIFSLYFGWKDVCFVPYSRTVPYGTRYPELLIRYVDRGTVLPCLPLLNWPLEKELFHAPHFSRSFCANVWVMRVLCYELSTRERSEKNGREVARRQKSDSSFLFLAHIVAAHIKGEPPT